MNEKPTLNKCLNCGKETENIKFCSHECHQYYFNHNEEYKKAFIDKMKRGIRLAEKEKKQYNIYKE